MDQKNLVFVPSLLPIIRGTVVDFTNSDDVQHNVFSPSPAGGKFNLGTYGPGAGRSVVCKLTGDLCWLTYNPPGRVTRATAANTGRTSGT